MYIGLGCRARTSTGAISRLPMHFRLRLEMIHVADGAQIWVEDVLVGRDGPPSALHSTIVDRIGGHVPF